VIVTRSRGPEDFEIALAPRWEPWRWWPARLACRGGICRARIEEVVATSCDGESARGGIGESFARDKGTRKHDEQRHEAAGNVYNK